MAFTRVHHVGIVTPDLGEARRVLCDGFGLDVDQHRSPWPQGRPGGFDDVTTVEVPIGEMHYEVSRPNSDRGEAAAFLASTGGRGGIYYISIASDSLASDLRRLEARGLAPTGAWRGTGPAFLDPARCLGLRIQVTPEEHYYAHPYYRGNGVVTGMAHIGIAARSAQEVRALLGDGLGLREDPSMERGLEPPRERPPRPADDPVHLLEYPIGGTVVEVSIPTTTDSGTARLVAQRAPLGAVYHHTCPFAPDVHRFVQQAVAAGLQQIGSIPPREQATRVVAWFHPRTCLGMLVEVWNRAPGEQHAHPGPTGQP